MRELILTVTAILMVSGPWSGLTSSVPALADTAPHAFMQAVPGYQFTFPRDHGAHPAYRTEWWYYTGHLQTSEGRPFGYELTFFRRAISPDRIKTLPSQWSVTQVYLAHFAVTDINGRRFYFSEKLSRPGLGKAGADETRLNVWIDAWRAQDSAGAAPALTLVAQDGDYAISLVLEPSKPAVVHGYDGISRKGQGSGDASHYYSFTRLATNGQLTVGKQSFPVSGTSWMDHEFGSADLDADLAGWDWFSLQLADNSELMLYRLRRHNGTSDPVSSGTVVFPDGRTKHLVLGDFTIETTKFWKSPASQATYPSTWRITVPSLELSVEVVPRVADQELRTSRSTRVTYWEGAVAVSGTRQGHVVTGDGYVELTGYDKRIPSKL